MNEEIYEAGFLSACEDYGLDEEDVEVIVKVAEELEKEAGVGELAKKGLGYGKKAAGAAGRAFTAADLRALRAAAKGGEKATLAQYLKAAAKPAAAYGGTGAGAYLAAKKLRNKK